MIIYHLQQFYSIDRKGLWAYDTKDCFLLRTENPHSQTQKLLPRENKSSFQKKTQIYLHHQLGLTQQQLLLWTIEEYEMLVNAVLKDFVLPTTSSYVQKIDDILQQEPTREISQNDLKKQKKVKNLFHDFAMCRRLANTVHHFAHAIEYYYTQLIPSLSRSVAPFEVPYTLQQIKQLRIHTYELLKSNLQELEWLIQEQQQHREQPNWTYPEDYLEIKKQVVITGQHLLSDPFHYTIPQKLLLCEELQGMLTAMKEIAHPAQHIAITQMSISLDYEQGKYYLQLEDYVRAYKSFETYYTLSKQLSTTLGPFILIQPLEYMGNIHSILEQYEEAYEKFQEAIEIVVTYYGKSYHDSLLTIYFNYATALIHHQQYDEGREKLNKVLQLLEYHHPEEEVRRNVPLYQQVQSLLKSIDTQFV